MTPRSELEDAIKARSETCSGETALFCLRPEIEKRSKELGLFFSHPHVLVLSGTVFAVAQTAFFSARKNPIARSREMALFSITLKVHYN